LILGGISSSNEEKMTRTIAHASRLAFAAAHAAGQRFANNNNNYS